MMNRIYCLNPDCLHPNPDNFKYCQKCGSKLVLTERYIPRSILGQGGFGRTFLATDQYKPSQPYCVIKQFLPQAQGTDSIEKASQLFAQEAQRLEELGKHPQIPELMAYFIVDGRQYLVQEFVQGNTLQAELDNNGVFSEKQIRELLLEILEILEFVHSKQVIHRDIKPENIIRRSSDNKLFLVDFGAAKVVKQQQRTATGTIIGSAEYCPPEQSMGKPLFISDLYSLGVTCLHLLTGTSPFDLYSPLEGEWVWRDYLNGNVVSDELGKILEKLAHPIAKHRFQSVAEVIHALNPVSQQFTESTSTVSLTTPVSMSSPSITASQEIKANNPHTIFDSEKMQQVVRRLEGLKQKIEQDYQRSHKEIDLSIKKQLQLLGYSQQEWDRYTQQNLEGMTLGQKGISSFFCLVIGFSGLPFGFIGLIWCGFCLFVCLKIFATPTINKKKAQQIQAIRDKADADRFKAGKNRVKELDNLKKHQKERVSFFKSIPIEMISEEYITTLSDEEQFYLLKAIQERKDAGKLGKHLKTAAKVVAGVGILAAFIGLGFRKS
jgi:serine/threonine protein kinase